MNRLLLFVLVFLLWCISPVFAQTVDLNIATAPPPAAANTPVLSWSSAPAGATCTGSGDAASSPWNGTKAASGSQTLAPVTVGRVYNLACAWPGDTQAVITWTIPTHNQPTVDANGVVQPATPYTNGKGFKVYRATDRTMLEAPSNPVRVIASASTTSTVFAGLAPGTWFFGVKATNALDVDGPMSDILTKTTTAGTTASDAVAITFPGTVIVTVR